MGRNLIRVLAKKKKKGGGNKGMILGSLYMKHTEVRLFISTESCFCVCIALGFKKENWGSVLSVLFGCLFLEEVQYLLWEAEVAESTVLLLLVF